MDGRAVWDCATRVVPEAAREVLAAHKLAPSDVDFVISHQANKNLALAILAELGIPAERTFTNIERYANTTSASVLIALDEAVRLGHVRPGQMILLIGIGAGMTWGAHLIRW
jgi:3-oxoacyl-[acyl-carrier-protein] synthase-3